MKVTYNWLREFVDFDLSVEQLSDLLTMLGLEVDGLEKQGAGMDDVVVAVVEEKRQHPNADKLSLCKVNNGKEILDVVCGAQNFKSGDFVALAQIGAVLPGDIKIKKSKIRGEESCGMLCSAKELGLAEESDGIMVLPAGSPLGIPVFEYLKLKDTIFEIGLTPNRADCLSVIGVAREIAAKLGKQMHIPACEPKQSEQAAADVISVTVENSELCPRYSARYISGCRVAPSPEWLVKRLSAVGVRSINNIVDVTNLVMMEMGQPLHAFDCDQLAGRRIIVRNAVEGEKFVTLDNQERLLKETDLVICDGDRPVALAGVMGGLNSEISDSTENVLLESAWFKPAAVRSTSKRLGLHTESSHRFERGVDIGGVVRALDRAAALMAELSGGSVAKGVIDVYPVEQQPAKIVFRPEKANALIGIQLSSTEITDILKSLELGVEQIEGKQLLVTVPTFRVDIEREIDLIEEVARLNGFDRIPATAPVAAVVSDRLPFQQSLERTVKNQLVAHGMTEVINFSFTRQDAADSLLLAEDDPRRSVIALANPLIEEHAVMRTTLLPGLLETVARNFNYRSLDLALFEMRRVYHPSSTDEMPREPLFIVGALTGQRDSEQWSRTSAPVDFYDAKGILENLFETLNINQLKWSTENPEPYYHPGICCNIFSGRGQIGSVGCIHPTVLDNFGLDKPVYCFELDFAQLVKLSSRAKRRLEVPSRFPDSSRDIAILAPDTLTAEKIVECAKSLKAQEIDNVEVFDVYQGKGIPEGFRSIAIRIRYRSFERTLTDDEILALHGRVKDNLVNKLNVTIR